MADQIVLTHPVIVEDLRAAFPRALLAAEDEEIEVWLEIQERALRSVYRVIRNDSDSDEALRTVMIATWLTFHQQVRNISSESASPDGHSVTYARATAAQNFYFPAFVEAMLIGVVDVDTAPSTTELVR